MMKVGSLFRVARRGFATRRVPLPEPIDQRILDVLPKFDDGDPIDEEFDPKPTAAFPHNPITSAYMIDVKAQKLSKTDSVAINPDGKVVHGLYGELSEQASAIPLEYLALLRPAAEGAAALRVATEKNKGTLLVYGATQADGWAASMIGASQGNAVVAVIDGQHSGNENMHECLKGLLPEPGTAVGEEYALSKKLFQELVHEISKGQEGIRKIPPSKYVQDFKELFVDYCEMYPDTRPAAVSAKHMEFDPSYMEKDREQFEANMTAYLSQFPPGAPPVNKPLLDQKLDEYQYEMFRKKFWKQTAGVISGDDTPFSAPHVLKKQIEEGEQAVLEDGTFPGAGPPFPYDFNILNPFYPAGTELPVGGPIVGAILSVTEPLQKAAQAIDKAKTLRQKAEALQFLSHTEKAALGAARSVSALATAANAPILVVGGTLPGLNPPPPATPQDVATVLECMDIDDSGNSALNYFVQCYRANDFPFYESYGIHRASEPLAGPRQIIVTK